MKKITLSILLVIIPAAAALACSCLEISQNDAYLRSDFVGTVKVTGISEAPENDTYRRTYFADLQPLATFKGKAPRRIRVAGSAGGINHGASCERDVNDGEEWLVALRKNSVGDYVMSLCSAASLLKTASGENVSRASQWRTIQHYQFLQRVVPGMHHEYDIRETSRLLDDFLDRFDGKTFDAEGGHYLITFDSTMAIQKVEVLKAFNDEFDAELMAFLKAKTTWEKSNPRYDKTPVKDGTQHLLGIYYYEGAKPFLSLY